MYTPAAYFWGRFISNLLVQLFYPVISVLFCYYGLGIDNDFETVLKMVGFAVLLNLAMCAQGYLCGMLSFDEQMAQ